jgi:hypothetical protein
MSFVGDLYVIALYMVNKITAIQGAFSSEINRKDLRRNVHWVDTQRQTVPCKKKNKLGFYSSGISRRVLLISLGRFAKAFCFQLQCKEVEDF